VTIKLSGFPDAKTVILAGSFNDWNEKKLQMTHSSDGWHITIQLISGKHTYKFIVDGQWITDPANPIKEDDGHGNVNSVMFVY
jgi:1,4-alpha-glucan branching enzyme